MNDGYDSGDFDSTDVSNSSNTDAGDTSDNISVRDTGDTEISVESGPLEISTGEVETANLESQNVSAFDLNNEAISLSPIEDIEISADSSENSEIEETNEISAETARNSFSEIGKAENLTTEEKVSSMQKIYETLSPEMKSEVTVPAKAEFLNKEQPFDKDGRPNYNWEGNMGFESPPQQTTLKEGMTIDRYGSEQGNYVCEVKNGVPQDYNSRALPYLENPEMYHQYEVVKSMDDFSQRIENLSVEEVQNIEIQKDLQKPEEERRTEDQIKSDAQERYINIQYDVQTSINRANQMAKDNGWDVNYQGAVSLKGEIKECFSYTDENGNEVKMGGGEQIALPASVDTLTYLGYLEEKA
ncbi:MAG: TNT domain-containing protein [Eubacterium sp.]|nr:TNT domain-containing protein [Eubacterium sp.]MCC8173577.1 TNT domain-containing protein [Odoribacter sp.]